MLAYVVKSGDYLAKIAHARGFDADQVWDDPKNADLKALRKDPNILHPGDVLYIPEPKPPDLPISGGSSNEYSATIPMVKVTIQFKDEGGLHANEKFVVDGGAVPAEGTSDGDGTVTFEVPVHVGSVRVDFPAHQLAYEVRVGGLDPVEESSGVASRLAHLGYGLDAAHEELREKLFGKDEGRLARAIADFQRDHGLPETGLLDDATRAALKEAHGS